MHKAQEVRSTFRNWDAIKVQAVVAPSTCRSHNVQSIPGLEHPLKFRCSLAWQGQGIWYPITSEQLWKFCSRFNYHHYSPLPFTSPHWTTLRYTTRYDTTSTTATTIQLQLQYTTPDNTRLTTLHYTALHYTSLHNNTLLQVQLHLHYIAQITLLYTTMA